MTSQLVKANNQLRSSVQADKKSTELIFKTANKYVQRDMAITVSSRPAIISNLEKETTAVFTGTHLTWNGSSNESGISIQAQATATISNGLAQSGWIDDYSASLSCTPLNEVRYLTKVSLFPPESGTRSLALEDCNAIWVWQTDADGNIVIIPTQEGLKDESNGSKLGVGKVGAFIVG